ncbi:hypothetical protein [Campylobacter sp. RM16188]|uniref:hypothetical protein n=1 Tax=Campylobacter sp. RM16188 TaxID=1705725 RepID=UPI001557886F|nr:hypothetical protein [Campylobacter sp. RM16188]
MKTEYIQLVRKHHDLASLVCSRLWMLFDVINKNRPFIRILGKDCIEEYIGNFYKKNYEDLVELYNSDKQYAGVYVTNFLEDQILLQTTNKDGETTPFFLPIIFACANDEEFKTFLEETRISLKKICYDILG